MWGEYERGALLNRAWRLMRPLLVFAIGTSLLMSSACAHHAPLTVITTRQNGTVKLCGKVSPGDKMIVGKTPEGSSISINASDVVTMEQNGVCK